jgi:hypothetical protein
VRWLNTRLVQAGTSSQQNSAGMRRRHRLPRQTGAERREAVTILDDVQRAFHNTGKRGKTHIAQVRLVRFWIIGRHREIARNRTAELIRGCWHMLALGTPVLLLSTSCGLDPCDVLLLA